MGEEEYRAEVLGEIIALLRGEGGEEHLEALVGERRRLAGELEFEAAARLRDLISGIERIRLTRAAVGSEGVQAVVAPSTEPGIIEIFALSGGCLVGHKGFEPENEAGIILFAEEVLKGQDEPAPPTGGGGADEARIVTAYLRRRQVDIEAVRLRQPADLVGAVSRVDGRAARTNAETKERSGT
jgi:DNA polymerase-3 subunit epsilon